MPPSRSPILTPTEEEANIRIERELALAGLTGARITFFQFILEYLIIGFDEKGALTTLVWPEIVERAGSLKYGEIGYRDGLCGLIGNVVRSATLENDETISVHCDGGTDLRIALKSHPLPGERAILTGPHHFLLVF